MKKLSVAILVPIFPNIVQTYVLSQIVALKNSDINTIIVAGKRGNDEKLPPEIGEYKMLENTVYISTEYNNILQEIFSLPIQNKLYRKAIKIIIDSWSLQKYEIKYFLKVAIRSKVFTHSAIDVIHSHSLFTSYDYLFLKEHFSIPIVTTYHGMVPNNVKQLEKDKQKTLFEKGDLFIVNTEFSKQQLIGLGCPREIIRIIPQGTNLDDFPFATRSIHPSSKIILLTVGRLSIEKGHHIAIHAVSELIKYFPTLEYHIVGEGPERNNLESIISKKQLETKVILHGMVASDVLTDHYSKSHIFILPSIDLCDGYHVETQGVVLQEAQASGIPVIASQTGGIPDVIRNHETGMLYKESDHHELTEIIRTLINEPDLYQKISRSGRLDVEERFNITHICKQIKSIYEELI